MLYRTPRTTITILIRAAVARVIGFVAEFHRTGIDTAYVESLSDHHLRDLGIRRVEDRDESLFLARNL
jgi:hypothetical protein